MMMSVPITNLSSYLLWWRCIKICNKLNSFWTLCKSAFALMHEWSFLGSCFGFVVCNSTDSTGGLSLSLPKRRPLRYNNFKVLYWSNAFNGELPTDELIIYQWRQTWNETLESSETFLKILWKIPSNEPNAWNEAQSSLQYLCVHFLLYTVLWSVNFVHVFDRFWPREAYHVQKWTNVALFKYHMQVKFGLLIWVSTI